MMNKIHDYKTQEELLEHLCKRIISDIQAAILKDGKASLLVSGGSTPKPLFEKLSLVDIAWEKVSIGLCDERWVDDKHKDSNAFFVKSVLLKNFAKKATFIPMYQADVSVDNAEELCSGIIQKELAPFDIVILGMGNDGHTASLFPHNIKLKEAFDSNNKNLCVCMEPQDAPHKRMSLTKTAILSARNIYLHFEGEEKQKVFKKALADRDDYNMPISSILNQDIKSIEVYYQ